MSAGEAWSRAGWRAHLPGTGDVPAYVDRLGEATIPELAAASADRVPDRVAVTVDGDPITHAELDADAARVAGWLARRVQPGHRVLLAAGAGLGFLRCYLGSLRAGAVVVLANPGCAAPELAHLVSDSGARVAFADPGPARLLARLPAPPQTVAVTRVPSGPPGRSGQRVRARPEDAALLAYTSGTTGRPKGVPLTHRQLVTSVCVAMAAWRWSADDVLVHALPLYHQHGLGGVHATLIAGGTGHVRSKFTPADIVATARATQASVLLGVPTMYQALLTATIGAGAPPPGAAAGAGRQPDRGSRGAGMGTPEGRPSLSGLRLAVCGSAPLNPALAERLPAVLGRLPLVRYGTTETGLNVSNTWDDPHADTIGVPLPGVMARLRSGAAEPAAGQDGEIQLRGPQVFGGYWQDPAATAAAFTQDGWFRTGDIGRVDPVSGQLVIRGRIKEMIISGGLNVYPAEVEMVLESHPSVAEAAVAGVPDGRWGERVTAWVVMRPGGEFDERALIAHARAQLTAYKCPKQVVERKALPRNEVGKLVRSALALDRRPGFTGQRS
jgi:acyl-CoA synthetase (AMP-forming)/AMP-acid ligase II